MNTPLTVESISAALRGSDFWLNPTSNAARIVTEAARLGYVTRLSHTQAQWTDEGLARARAELTPAPAQAAAFTTHLATTARNLGPSTVAEIEQARELYRQHPETYLANDFQSADRAGARVFVSGPVGLFKQTPEQWTVEQVVALARGFGMREFKSLTEFEQADPGAKYLRVGVERHAKIFLYDPERKLTVIPFNASLTLCATGQGVTSLINPVHAAEWLMRRYCPELTVSSIRPSRFKGTTDDGLAVYAVDERVIGR